MDALISMCCSALQHWYFGIGRTFPRADSCFRTAQTPLIDDGGRNRRASSSTRHLENVMMWILQSTYFEISMLSSNEEKSKISSSMLHHVFFMCFPTIFEFFPIINFWVPASAPPAVPCATVTLASAKWGVHIYVKYAKYGLLHILYILLHIIAYF